MATCSGGAQSEIQRSQEGQRPKSQPQFGGYNCEFVERPPKAFQCECPICLLVLHEPHQATCCGNSFCETCVKRIQTHKKPCPTCNQVDYTVFPDKRLKRSLNDYHVYCSHKGEGCKWVGELGELDRHLNLQPPPDKLLVGCHFSEIGCTYCSDSVSVSSVATWLSTNLMSVSSDPMHVSIVEHMNRHMRM